MKNKWIVFLFFMVEIIFIHLQEYDITNGYESQFKFETQAHQRATASTEEQYSVL